MKNLVLSEIGVDEMFVTLGCPISSENVTGRADTLGCRFWMPLQRFRAASFSDPYVIAEQFLPLWMQRVQRPSDDSTTH